jgi:BASS family bile acid:Na+ symporter
VQNLPARARHIVGLHGKTGLLLLAIVAGISFPQAHGLVFLVPYLVATMLFFSFLDLSIGRHSFERGVWGILAANLTIAFAGYGLLLPWSRDLALVAFFAGISPTAIAAPAIIALLHGRVEYVVASVLVTNLAMAALLPPVLPLVAGAGTPVSVREVALVIGQIVLLPMFAARIAGMLPRTVLSFVRKGKPLTFYALPPSIFLTTSKAVFFISREATVPPMTLVAIALVSLAVCAASFSTGAFIGGSRRRREASQALGQKNNSFTIWLALTFVSPLAALGPTFYVVYHNVYNSLQLYAFERKRNFSGPGSDSLHRQDPGGDQRLQGEGQEG